MTMVAANPEQATDELLPHVPEGWKRMGASPVLSGESEPRVARCFEISGEPNRWRFHRGVTCLVSSKPVRVRVIREGAAYLAMNECLGICAVGDTKEEAVAEFEGEVVHFYKHYAKLRDDQVTGLALRLKKLYAEFFREEA